MYKKIVIGVLSFFTLLDMPLHGMRRTVRSRVIAPYAAKFARIFATRMHPIRRWSASGRRHFSSQSHQSDGKREHTSTFFERNARGIVCSLGALGLGAILFKAYTEKPEPVTFENTFGFRPFEKQRRAYYEHLLLKPWGAVAKKYIDEFDQEEKALCQEWQSICAELYKKAPRIVSYKDYWYQELSAQEKEQLFLSQEKCSQIFKKYTMIHIISDLISDLLEESDIKQEECRQTCQEYTMFQSFSIIWELLKKFDMKHVLIKPLDDAVLEKNKSRFGNSMGARIAAAATYRNSGFYYKQPMLIYDVSLPANNHFKAVVMHEIQHLLHNDPISRGIIASALEKIPIKYTADKKNIEEFSYKFARFTEKRADILGCLAAIEYAQGAQAYWWYPGPLNKIADSCWLSKVHAKPTEQYKYFKKLSEEMAQTEKEHCRQGTHR